MLSFHADLLTKMVPCIFIMVVQILSLQLQLYLYKKSCNRYRFKYYCAVVLAVISGIAAVPLLVVLV